MKVKDLKEAINGIQMGEEMQKKIVSNIKAQTDKREEKNRVSRIRMPQWQKVAAAAVIVFAALGLAAFPVRAFVNSLIQERMEEMTGEEIAAVNEAVEKQESEADSYSRAYTDSEKERYQELYQQYQSGSFPEGEILKVDSREEAGGSEFYYLTTTACFYLPERELTDEELLEIIDFILKREYAFNKQYEEEHAREIAREKETEKQEISENVESGGITQQQAIDTAAGLLDIIYGITGESMELTSYYENGDGESSEAYYCVNWTDIIAHQYYYFFISAKDGHLKQTTHSSGDIADAQGVTVEDAESRITGLSEKASSFIKETIGDEYKEEYVYYLIRTDETTTSKVRFLFEKDDETIYEVTYLWDGTFTGFEETGSSTYENGQTLLKNVGGAMEELKTVFRLIFD